MFFHMIYYLTWFKVFTDIHIWCDLDLFIKTECARAVFGIYHHKKIKHDILKTVDA